LVSVYAAFHFTTLEEYYCGTLYLGKCNGVTDGSFIIVVACFITGCVGNNFWATPVIDIAWLNINGVPMLTWGQIAALAIALANFLDSVWK
jgi:hypothetical protein